MISMATDAPALLLRRSSFSGRLSSACIVVATAMVVFFYANGGVNVSTRELPQYLLFAIICVTFFNLISLTLPTHTISYLIMALAGACRSSGWLLLLTLWLPSSWSQTRSPNLLPETDGKVRCCLLHLHERCSKIGGRWGVSLSYCLLCPVNRFASSNHYLLVDHS